MLETKHTSSRWVSALSCALSISPPPSLSALNALSLFCTLCVFSPADCLGLFTMSTPAYSSTPIVVDPGPEVSTAPWPRADDPKQAYIDTSAGMPTPQMKPENNYHYSGHDQATASPQQSPKGKKMLFGLGILGWSALLVTLTAIIVGAAVGGGVGSALSSCNSDKSDLNNKLASCSAPTGNTTGSDGAPSVSVALVTATVTISSSSTSGTAVVAPVDLSNFTVVYPATVSNIFTGCPALDKQSYTSTRGDDYTIYCDTDSGYGSASLEDPSLTLQVFAGFLSYTLDDCMEACSAFNAFSARNNVPEMQCRSITFNHKMSQSIQNNGYVNCWVKNATVSESSLSASGDTICAMMQG